MNEKERGGVGVRRGRRKASKGVLGGVPTVCPAVYVIDVLSSVLAIEGPERGEGFLPVNLLLVALKQVSWPAVTLFVAGNGFLVLYLFYFLEEERYRRAPKPEQGVEFLVTRRVVEDRISALAPRALLPAEKEKFVVGRLEEGALSEEARRRGEGLLLWEAVHIGFWEKFVGVTTLADFDPDRVYQELRHPSTMADATRERLSRAEEVICGGEDASYK